jgi:hypothetical protein
LPSYLVPELFSTVLNLTGPRIADCQLTSESSRYNGYHLAMNSFLLLVTKSISSWCLIIPSDSNRAVGEDRVSEMSSTVPKSANIFWHDCPVGMADRQKLLKQKGCVVWITGLSGSGKYTSIYLKQLCSVHHAMPVHLLICQAWIIFCSTDWYFLTLDK